MSTKTENKKTVKKTNTKLDRLVEVAKTKKEVKQQLSFKLDPKLVEVMKQVAEDKGVNLTAIVEVILKDTFNVK